ncbi:hypothetical protein ABPG72_014384 [Tetrahymena utriculariae]
MNCLRNLQNSIPTNRKESLDYTPINEKKSNSSNVESQKYLSPQQLGQSYSTQPSFRSPMSGENSSCCQNQQQINFIQQVHPSLPCFEEEFENSSAEGICTPQNGNNKDSASKQLSVQASSFSQKSDYSIQLFNQLSEQFSNISLEDQTIGSPCLQNNSSYFQEKFQKSESNFYNMNDTFLNSTQNSKTPYGIRNQYIENPDIEFFLKKGIMSARYSNSNAFAKRSEEQSTPKNQNGMEESFDGIINKFDEALEVSDFTQKVKQDDLVMQIPLQTPKTQRKLKEDDWKENFSSPERLSLQTSLFSKNKTQFDNQLCTLANNNQAIPTTIWKSSKQKFNKKKADRFIPNRKTSKLSIALTSAHEIIDENENKNYLKGELYEKQSQVSIEELYKSHILGISNNNQKTPFGISSSQFSQYFANHGSSMIPPRYVNNSSQEVERSSNTPHLPIYLTQDENEVTKTIQSFSNQNILRFKDSPQKNKQDIGKYLPEYSNKYSLIDNQNSCIFDFKRKETRKINKIPFKVLDAPSLQDDFYLNLVDWSSNNILAVALGSCVYLWKADNNKVIKFCDLGSTSVTSVAWHPKGHQLSLGTSAGQVQVWDASSLKMLRSYNDHAVRVGSLSWSTSLLACGSRDKTISLRDLRDDSTIVRKFKEHKQEVCGLKWSFDEQYLASGGNDNKLFVWNNHSTIPICKFTQHTAAVKAIAWSPHQHGLLASGGGTQDRCIRFWNTQTSTMLDYIDTQSQVCNLMFGKTENEIVSTHGYSLNQIVVWKYPSLQKIAELTGHTSRVLFLAMSPDGQTIVTGAGDETLRFWKVFPSVNDGYRPPSVLVNDIRDLR